VWSSQLDFSAIAAQVGLAGVLHYTTLPLSSLANESGAVGSVTIEELIQRSENHKFSGSFAMRGCVNNDNLINIQQAPLSPHAFPNDSPLSGEVIHVCIVDSAYLTFNTGALQAYSLSVQSVAHYATFPRTDDNFARSLLDVN
jgi:hypothetical protein